MSFPSSYICIKNENKVIQQVQWTSTPTLDAQNLQTYGYDMKVNVKKVSACFANSCKVLKDCSLRQLDTERKGTKMCTNKPHTTNHREDCPEGTNGDSVLREKSLQYILPLCTSS